PLDALLGLDRDWTDLDRAERGGRATRRPFERGVERRQLHDDEARKLFLRVGVGTVLDLTAAALRADRRSGLRKMKRIAADVAARGDHRPVVGAPGADVGIVVTVFPAREVFQRFVDQ